LIAPDKYAQEKPEMVQKTLNALYGALALRVKALYQPAEINHHPLMGASPDLLDFITRRHGKDDPSPADLGDFRLRRHVLPDRRRGEMTNEALKRDEVSLNRFGISKSGRF
jgi:hypothetical protein